jgi:serine/threonine protein kinase
VAGGELFDRICDKTVYTEAEARSLVVTLLTTLNYLHKKKIAHRDLKPENLLLRSKDNDTDIVLAGK